MDTPGLGQGGDTFLQIRKGWEVAVPNGGPPQATPPHPALLRTRPCTSRQDLQSTHRGARRSPPLLRYLTPEPQAHAALRCVSTWGARCVCGRARVQAPLVPGLRTHRPGPQLSSCPRLTASSAHPVLGPGHVPAGREAKGARQVRRPEAGAWSQQSGQPAPLLPAQLTAPHPHPHPQGHDTF